MFVALQIFNICFFNAMINRWMISFAMINRVLALSVICVQSSNYTNGSEDQLISATTTTAAAATIQHYPGVSNGIKEALRHIAHGVRHIHSLRIVHRDLKI